jgi:hypothetical protein
MPGGPVSSEQERAWRGRLVGADFGDAGGFEPVASVVQGDRDGLF